MNYRNVLAVLAVPVFILVACGQEVPYRYPCQDPANWESAQCQKPQCEVDRTCPDQIFKNFEELKGSK